MIQIQVVSLKKLIKKMVISIFLICSLAICIRFIWQTIKNITIQNEKELLTNSVMAYYKEEEDTKNSIKRLYNHQFAFADFIDDRKSKEDKYLGNFNTKKEEKSSSIKETNLETELLASGKVRVGSVYITNYTKRELDLEELSKPSTYPFTKSSNVLLYHTHTSESYTPSKNYDYSQSDFFRTEDTKYNVISVGERFINELAQYQIRAKQNKTQHDYPSYNGAYRASLVSIEKEMKSKKYDVLIDIHRDALSGNPNFRPTANINGEVAAKLMFVVGTNAAGLEHDQWVENLKFAIKIQEKANEMYPGLFRDMTLSSSRYNQHVSPGCFIIEVGATGNTLEEANTAMKYFASVMNEICED